jgi:AraC family transcriptional regulator
MADGLGTIHDVVEELAASSSAIANLCALGAHARVEEHRHANPYLWLHVLGAHAEAGDVAEAAVAGSTAMFFPAGSAHGMAVRDVGLASIIIEFDEAALGRALGPHVDLRRPRLWTGGLLARRARRLARLWLAETVSDVDAFDVTQAFLAQALGAPDERPGPSWLGALDAGLDVSERVPGADALARRFGVSGPWLARAYRRWRGEGIGEAVRRRRVETAAVLLETETAGIADVAIQAGFCDQSHMTRAFNQLLGRTPAAIRAARLGLAGQTACASPASSELAADQRARLRA